MRVIGGEFRSRVLKSVPGPDVRPTPDRLREALFNVLSARIEGRVFADVYAGTGAVGIEALSRGAERAILVECNRAAINVIRANLKALGLEPRSQLLQTKALAALSGLRADIVFIDPPYQMEKEYTAALEILGRRPLVEVIVQHDVRLQLEERHGALARVRVIRQGDNCLSFYQ